MSGYENLGPIVSQHPQEVTPGGGNFSADERSYDSVVFQQNCPPMDWEVNLLQSVIGNSGLRTFAAKLFPSSFISGNVLESDSPGSAYTFLAASAGNENRLQLDSCDLLVNGWNVHLEYTNTGTPGKNTLLLDSPPASGVRQDLVILEVWRALLSPLPSTDNKSPAGQVFRHGNAKAPDAAPNVNLSDDLVDPSYGSETAKRVQVQYRLRSIPGVNLISYPDGLDDPTSSPHTISYYSGSTVDGNNLPSYSYAPVSGDPGLWRAGDGNAASASNIGSVDGYIYAVPVCCVVRRNISAFNKVGNLNGGSLIGSSATRPDGLFSDQIVSGDTIDLRKFACNNVSEYRDKATSALLRNALGTQLEIDISGVGGNAFTSKESIGAASHVGDADGIRMAFSDKPITQPFPVVQNIAAPTSTVTVSLNGPVNLPWSPGVNILSKSPTGTALLALSKAYLDDGSGNTYDLFDTTSTYYITNIVYSVSGTVVDTFTVTTNIPVPVGNFYAECLVDYPRNSGLSRNLLSLESVWVPNSFAGWVDTAQFTATSDATRNSANGYYSSNIVNREINYSIPTVSTSVTVNSITTTTVMIPDMVKPVTVTLGGGLVVTNVEANAGCTIISFTPPLVSPGLPVSVSYVGLRAHPQLGAAPFDTIDIFHRTRSIQSIPVPAGSVQAYFYKRSDFDRMFFITAGSGNYNDTLYDASSQFPIPITPTVLFSDSLMLGYHNSSIVTNDEITGISKIPVTANSLESPDGFFVKTTGGITKDADGRNFWPFSSTANTVSFNTAPYNNITRRKLVSDSVVELAADIPGIGRKGQMFLAASVGFRYSDYKNQINTNDTLAIDCVALYKLQGNPLNVRRTS